MEDKKREKVKINLSKGKCGYRTGKCVEDRSVKANGSLHRFCKFHREKANSNQRRLDLRRRGIIKEYTGLFNMGKYITLVDSGNKYSKTEKRCEMVKTNDFRKRKYCCERENFRIYRAQGSMIPKKVNSLPKNTVLLMEHEEEEFNSLQRFDSTILFKNDADYISALLDCIPESFPPLDL